MRLARPGAGACRALPGGPLRLDRGAPRDGDAGHGVTSEAAAVDRVFRSEFGRAVALLARVLGAIGLAEDAVQDAYLAPLRRWPADLAPDNPRAGIGAVARTRA